MPSLKIIFEGDTLVKLLTAYFDGEVPLDAKILNVMVSPVLNRWIGIEIESGQWPDLPNTNGQPEYLHLRYEGRRNMRWSKADGDKPINWGTEGSEFEIPK
jgi:hypothetical protein